MTTINPDLIGLLAIDADDTLWHNQNHYDNVKAAYDEIMRPWGDEEETARQLYACELANMPVLGYGCKAFTISMVENALKQSGGEVTVEKLKEIIDLGKSMLTLPTIPLDGVETTLKALREPLSCPIVAFTKGELLDQEGKLERSGLAPLLDDIVVVSDKTPDAYRRLCKRYGIDEEQLVMVGNSFKSDIEPVLQIGGRAIYIPYHSTWVHEVVDEYDHERLVRLDRFDQINVDLLAKLVSL